MEKSVAVILPCHNEEVSIAKTIAHFRAALPHATIYVCDNRSTDRTTEVALANGAIVLHENRKGKGNAVRKLFSSIDADVYVLSDGDETYDATFAPELIALLAEKRLDMVIGRRVESGEGTIYRAGHRTGNLFFNFFLKFLFKSTFNDVFSGYRVFSRAFVKSFPIHSSGFEIETEMSVHALSLHLDSVEVDTPYRARPAGSFSKLNKYRDGLRILRKMLQLFVEFKPLAFFGFFFGLFAICGTALFVPVFLEYLETGLVPRIPTLIVSTLFYSLSALCFIFGVLLHFIAKSRLEMKKLAYLQSSLR